MLDLFKSLLPKKERQWCGVCLFELNPTAKSHALSSDIGGRYEYAFEESDDHEFSFADLIKSSKRGCDRCKALASAFESFGVAGFEVARWEPHLNSPGSPLLEITSADGTSQVFEICSSETPLDRPVFFADDPLPHVVLCRGYKLSRTTGDNEALDQAAKWLTECRTSHGECRVSDAEFVPNRLLYLGDSRTDSNILELVEKAAAVSYAALSHRWTKETPAKSLLTSNFLDRKQNGMPIAYLPRMMQDVVRVLRRLGIEYIWIDCLCIIQDDKDDWKREAALMASIYTNAELTVAASWCDQPDQNGQSIFIRRRKHHFTWLGIESSADTMAAENPDIEWPLLNRGWVYQEQLLSRRMLHFTQNELIWECFEETRCECGWYDNNTRIFGARDWYKRSPATKSWSQVIKGYAKRPLTVTTDRLPALAGIGKAIASAKDYDAAEYLCGFWEKELEETFFWYLSEPPCHPRPDMRMPTWSWASVSGDVECWQVSLEGIEFLGSDVQYSGDPLLGDVVSGMVSLSGHVASGVVYHGQEWTSILESQKDASGMSSILTDSRATEEYGLQIGGQFATFNPDYKLDIPGKGFVPSGSQILCLLFGRTTSSEWDESEESTETITTHLLLLRCVDGTPLRYERIGVNATCFELKVFMSQSERQQLTLV
ncbi:heterokaryon incompatibility protein (HET) domain-containing protein [Trichoderma breve]|uniref:Heterokaryon incompatibility protein (HET) domain-containing protein n=1 Tax=Trichoderma breve TaxID=2034170 RepID=A0A9W9BJF0_9HYPO|nr:heterokaryon incompatibility protein (HET) domain-containing protein [Trichoderma breve]KAJ4861465.1 heterokaryon incompatibility protein (HET) domain-containing protein [Trichoderma breve]